MTGLANCTLDDLRASRDAVVTRVVVAAVLGVDPRTVTAAIAAGTIPSIRLGLRAGRTATRPSATWRAKRLVTTLRSTSSGDSS